MYKYRIKIKSLCPHTFGNIEMLANDCQRLTAIDMAAAAREFIADYDGNMKNISNNTTWLRLKKANDVKVAVRAKDLDNGPLSMKYGTTLNFGLEWDEIKGIKVQTESLGNIIIITIIKEQATL